MKRYLMPAILTATAVGWMLAPLPAGAAPEGTEVDRVFQLPCAGGVCDPSGDADRLLDENDAVHRDIQIHVKTTSNIGLDWVEVQARRKVGDGWDGDWTCLKHWSGSEQTTFSDWYDWDTTEWPGSPGDPPGACPSSSFHGALTKNGPYGIRVVAKEREVIGDGISDSTDVSGSFYVNVNNKPSEPQWAADPVVTKEHGFPEVVLRWNAVPEPDVVEYHFIRSTDSDEREYAVSAKNPGGQGCDWDGAAYTCFDDDFPSKGYGDDYTYSLVAYRSSPTSNQSCSIGGGDCVQSSMSGERTAEIDEPAPPPSGSPTGSPTSGGGSPTAGPTTPGSSPTPEQVGDLDGDGDADDDDVAVLNNRRSRPDYSEFYEGEYEKTLPYDNGTPDPERIPYALRPKGTGSALALPADDGPVPVDRRLWVFLAGGLALMTTAGHLGRLLRIR